MFIIFVAASVVFLIHMLVLLFKYIKKDSTYNRNVRVYGGYIVGAHKGINHEILCDNRDNTDTVIIDSRKLHTPVTSSFAYIYIRLYDLGRNVNYDFYLDNSVMIGRVGGEADIQLNDKLVSLKHCMLYRKGEEIFLQDLGSTNHTYLNNCMVECPMPLAFGDRIVVGNNCFDFQFYNV